MGFKTKRRAKRLPELLVNLDAAEGQIENRRKALGDSATTEQRESSAFLGQRTRDHRAKAQAYMTEFDQTGGIADPGFDDWFTSAKAFANVAQMTPEEFQTMHKVVSRLPGGLD